jgi:hypothetical protein
MQITKQDQTYLAVAKPNQDGDKHFAGSLYVKNGKTYNVELPKGDIVVLCYVTGKDGPSLQIISSSWCQKTALDVQTDTRSKP